MGRLYIYFYLEPVSLSSILGRNNPAQTKQGSSKGSRYIYIVDLYGKLVGTVNIPIPWNPLGIYLYVVVASINFWGQ